MTTDAPLVLAIPSKGRLQENAAAFFARAGLNLVQAGGAREYRAAFTGLSDVEIVFLSASDIVAQLASGQAHLGVTGEDLVREYVPGADDKVEFLAPLGFGFANVVVAVPKAWIDVRTVADLDDVAADMRARHGQRLRIATKYLNLTRRFFASHGIADYRIVESLGATEGAPATGQAEAIVDITTTGATLQANGLKVLDDGLILRSEAQFVASISASWGPRARAAARAVLSRIAAEEEARTSRQVRSFVPGLRAEAAAEIAARFGARLPFGFDEGRSNLFLCPRRQVPDLVAILEEQGADDIVVSAMEAVFRRSNPLAERLWRRLGAGTGQVADTTP